MSDVPMFHKLLDQDSLPWLGSMCLGFRVLSYIHIWASLDFLERERRVTLHTCKMLLCVPKVAVRSWCFLCLFSAVSSSAFSSTASALLYSIPCTLASILKICSIISKTSEHNHSQHSRRKGMGLNLFIFLSIHLPFRRKWVRA